MLSEQQLQELEFAIQHPEKFSVKELEEKMALITKYNKELKKRDSESTSNLAKLKDKLQK